MGCTQSGPGNLLDAGERPSVAAGKDFREQLVWERTEDVFNRYEAVKELATGASFVAAA